MHYGYLVSLELTTSDNRLQRGHPTMSAIEISAGQLGIRYLVDGSQTASMGMFELTVPPASNVPPPHSHSNNEELVYVLEGTLRYTVGSDTRDLGPGQSMRTPRGTVHAFSNPFDRPARALVILSPDIGAQYFKDVAAVINAGGPPDKAALVAVMGRYGLAPAAPSVV
jgi:quercetin dioxygenase-like cupin family protein